MIVKEYHSDKFGDRVSIMGTLEEFDLAGIDHSTCEVAPPTKQGVVLLTKRGTPEEMEDDVQKCNEFEDSKVEHSPKSTKMWFAELEEPDMLIEAIETWPHNKAVNAWRLQEAGNLKRDEAKLLMQLMWFEGWLNGKSQFTSAAKHAVREIDDMRRLLQR
jgi:hypothetical protein